MYILWATAEGGYMQNVIERNGSVSLGRQEGPVVINIIQMTSTHKPGSRGPVVEGERSIITTLNATRNNNRVFLYLEGYIFFRLLQLISKGGGNDSLGFYPTLKGSFAKKERESKRKAKNNLCRELLIQLFCFWA